jgi:amino acid adenylation domain-containing protein
VHHGFARQARLTPSRVALESEGRTVTYAQLLTAGTGLARHLIELGVSSGSLVGVCAERSPELVAGMLGVLMAGGAYVPLDPAYPADRIRFMVRDAGLRVLLQDRPSKRLPAGGAAVVSLEHVWEEPAGDATSAVVREADPDDPVWVIYTSGSTGEPKGVVALHRGLSNFLGAMQELLGLGEDDVVLGLTSPSFDPAALEIFLPLVVGARVVLVPGEETIFGGRLAGLLDATGTTIMQATPTGWRLLLDGGWSGRPGLTMLSGGEVLSPELASALLARGGKLWNLYGPTETTVWSSAHRVSAGEAPVPIGRPIANVRFAVLGSDREPVTPGEVGELAIGGEGVARGYLGRPKLTAARFVSGGDGDPWYLSGDLARERRDGTFEFAGRIDHQVKVRGYRIELGEVEAALASHPDVRAAAACALGEEAERRLIGYAVLRDGSAATARRLRRHVAERLPSYMVPADVVLLDDLPLTPAGKLDRGALPPVPLRA